MAASVILDRRSAPRQDRRRARRLLGGRDGRAGAGLARPRRGRAFRLATVLVFWVAFAVGFLVKGPLVPLFAGLLRRGPLDSRALGALAAGPASGSRPPVDACSWSRPGSSPSRSRAAAPSSRGPSGDDMLGKVATGQQQHWAPPGFYLVAFFATFWPAAALRGPCGALRVAASARGRARLRARLGRSRPGSSSRRCRPSCRITCCRSTRRSPSSTVLAMARGAIGRAASGREAVALLIPLVPLGLDGRPCGYAAWRFDGPLALAGLALLGAAPVSPSLAWLALRPRRPRAPRRWPASPPPCWSPSARSG